jgi:uncharacterized protein YciI
MITIALCLDSPTARLDRPRLLQPHLAYLRTISGDIRLAAPLANADGAAIADDDRLVGSLFAFETQSINIARKMVTADPYAGSGVWSQMVVYEAENLSGDWVTEPSTLLRSKTPKLLYASFCGASNATADPNIAAHFRQHRDYTNHVGQPLRFSAKLSSGCTVSPANGIDDWQSLDVFCADSIRNAESIVSASPVVRDGEWRAIVFAIPLTAGSWAADIAL